MNAMLGWLQQQMAAVGVRLDAGETATLARQLEFISAKTYDVKYAELKGRRFVPVNSAVDSGAEFYVYRQWDQFGMAKIVANYADDLPRVDVLAKEFTSPIKSIGASYGYSIQDLRRAAMSGQQLDAKRALATRRAYEQTIDNVIAFGNAAAGLTGLTNNANVPLVAPLGAAWDTLAPLDIVADMNLLVNSIVEATLETFTPDTLLLDSHSFSVVNSLPMSTTGDADKTVLRFFLDNNPYIRSIEQWNRLNDAGAMGVTRIVAYKRDAEVLEFIESQPYEQLPPQWRNLEAVIPTHGRIGSVVMHYPLALAYMDGTGE